MNFSMDQIFGQFKDLEGKMKAMQAQMADLKVEGEAGAGLVKVSLNGLGEVVDIEIDQSIYQEDKVVLQDLLKGALNAANAKLDAAKKEKMGQMSGVPMDLFKNFGL
jgi:DNA-binding YbaB/EbfC family protein